MIQSSIDIELVRAELALMEQAGEPTVELTDDDVVEAVEQSEPVVALKTRIGDLKATMQNLEKRLKDYEQDDRYARLKQQVAEAEAELEEIRPELQQQFRDAVIAQNQGQYRDRVRELEARKLAAEKTIEQLKVQVREALEEMGLTDTQSLDIAFARDELYMHEQVHEQIASKIIAIQTQRNAPGRLDIVDKAKQPTRPNERLPWKKLALAIVGCLGLPFGLAAAWEHAVQRVEDADIFRAATNLPVVAEIAALPRNASSRGGERTSKRELSLFEESIDSLRTTIRLAQPLQDMRVLAVVSAVAQEGKTSVSSQLAISMARASRQPILLIDADIRSPDIDQIFEIPNQLGLADILAGECRVSEAIHVDYSPRLHLLPAGQLDAHPHELIGDVGLADILEELKESYRYIIIDTPPVLAASESLVFATQADASLVCARRGHSRVRQTREAYHRLYQANARPFGVVISGIPVARYGYNYGRYRYSYGYGYGYNYSYNYPY
jgi:capsular exopolysaccharide synthesis family protein